MDKLFKDSDSDNDEVSLKTDNEYAKKYDAWREKEELHKLEQKYGDKDLKSDVENSSDSEDDEEEPQEMSTEMEKAFLKTLSLLKNKDPRIYDPNYKFFEEVPKEKQSETKESETNETKPKKEVNTLAAAFADSDSDNENGEIFKVEKRTPEVYPKEDEIKEYLTGQKEHVTEDVEQDLAPLKALWSDPKLNENEAFLRDYILNKRYLGGDDDDTAANDKLLDYETLEVDEERIEEQGKFERAYNFRFEEPDQEYLKRYPRTMNYIRPKDERRARKRAEIRTRKEEEKKKKMEEIARLKALKLKEIQEKIAKIKEVTGNEELAFKEEDIEGDFDPEEHDRRMKAIFDEQYYDDNPDAEKPVFPDLDEELEIENWEKYEAECFKNQNKNENNEGPHCEDDDFNMDADYDPNRARKNLMEEIKETLGKKRRHRKKKSKLAEILAKEKPKYVPEVADRTYDQYMEEYYQMDCEDVIGGDLPTRFKYREVVPNSFGLTVEEILLADDKDLNKWASLKKTVKYRPDNVEKGEVKTYQKKAMDVELKKKILPSLFKDIAEEPELDVSTETRKKKKKKKNKNKDKVLIERENEVDVSVNNEVVNDTKQKRAKETQLLNNDSSEDKIEEKLVRNNKKRKSESLYSNDDSSNYHGGGESKPKKVNKLKLDDEMQNNGLLQHITEDNSIKKNKKRKRMNASNIVDTSNEHFVSGSLDKSPVNNIKNKKQSNQGVLQQPGTSSELGVTSGKEMKKKKNLKRKLKVLLENEGNQSKKKNPVVEMTNSDAKKKKNKKNVNDNVNFKSKKPSNDLNENPFSKLSDERLKAYGLNPKKYRSFLKYKKF